MEWFDCAGFCPRCYIPFFFVQSDSKANVALREHDASIAAAEQEEQQLMKEIEAEENTSCDTDAESANDTETVLL